MIIFEYSVNYMEIFMKKGKSRTRRARWNLMRNSAANARRRQQAEKIYDRQAYDTPHGEGA